MRYITRDREQVYLKCGKCKRICAYDRTQFEIQQGSGRDDNDGRDEEQQEQSGQKRRKRGMKRWMLRGTCANCNVEFNSIRMYPLRLPSFLHWWPLILMTGLFLLVIFIMYFPLFQRNYLFNKSITTLNPLFASIMIPVLCSVITVISNLSSFKKPKEEKPDSFKIRYALLVGIAVECVFLVFVINLIIQTQYHSLDIKDANTGEVRQYYGNAIGDIASGKGRLFDSQGNLIYSGSFKDGLFDGYGEKWSRITTIRNTDIAQTYQCVYKGEFKNGLPDGKGKEYSYDAEYIFEKDESVSPYLHYDGQFLKGKYNGIGTLYDISSKYEGSFYDNAYNGYGSYWFEDNDLVYKVTGVYSNGDLDGEGIKYFPGGNVIFDGIYKDDKAVSGTSYYEDGSILYNGDMDGNDYDGEGTLYWQNGNVKYKGRWEEGYRDGYGISYREDGTMEYAGHWERNEYHSDGRVYFEDGKTIYLSGNFYDGSLYGYGEEYYQYGTLRMKGEWKNGKMDGEGSWYWENGKKYYKGEFVNGNVQGKGVTYTKTGVKDYEGEFENGERNGYGISYFKNGKIEYEGNWMNGKYSGEGIKYDEDGEIEYEGMFSDGSYIK